MKHPSERNPSWVWWVCGLLLLASTINYMDRQTLSVTSKRIIEEFDLSKRQYGDLELAFGWAFAAGATLFGILADRTNVRWLYPIVLLLWSTMGFATGLVETFWGLLFCRLFLGLFEAGHWPCALKTTQRLLPPGKRTLGNSVLQSGTAIGAIVTPLIMKATLTTERGSWRPAFQIIGATGVVWVILWLISIRDRDMVDQQEKQDEKAPNDGVSGSAHNESVALIDNSPTTPVPDNSFWAALFSRRFAVLLLVVISINACWHLFRVWLPLFLQQGRGYSENAMLDFNFWFNVMTDVGCLSAGFGTAWLNRNGWTVHRSRTLVFSVCAGLVALGGLIPLLPQGPILLGMLLLAGAGALGLFPCYYSLSQELSTKHQGKITGLLGSAAWLTTSPLHPLFGHWVDQTKSYDLGMCFASLIPLAGVAALIWLWPKEGIAGGS